MIVTHIKDMPAGWTRSGKLNTMYMSLSIYLYIYLSINLSIYLPIKAWVDSWLDVVGEIEHYVAEFHPKGLKWNRH